MSSRAHTHARAHTQAALSRAWRSVYAEAEIAKTSRHRMKRNDSREFAVSRSDAYLQHRLQAIYRSDLDAYIHERERVRERERE